jgi:single-stranded DNA-binding protein
MYLYIVGSSYTEKYSDKDGRYKSLLKVSNSQFLIGSLRNMRKLSGEVPYFMCEIRAGYSSVGAGIA